MKKSYLTNHDEIDIFKVVKTIWDGKIKIALIIGISFLVGVYYNYSTAELFNSSVIIKPGKNSQFQKFQKITAFLNLYEARINNQITNKAENYFILTNKTILTRFVDELMDYEELMVVLKSFEKKYDNSKLSKTEFEQKIFNYAKSFKINKMEKKPDYFLKFTWDNNKESIEIIDKTIKLAIINFKKSFFSELNETLDVKKIVIMSKDKSRIEYLKEQSQIAKKLNISKNILENFNSQDQYYMRGFEAIDEEIGLIQTRKYKYFDIIEKDIKFLKELDMQWINYSNFLIETKSNKNPKKILIYSILIGLVAGIFFTLISDILKSKKSS